MTENIIKLTPEQEALIPVYREKWRQIALSTKPCDSLLFEKAKRLRDSYSAYAPGYEENASRASAAEAVKVAYAAIDEKEPEILFFESPYAVLKQLEGQKLRQRRSMLYERIVRQLYDRINKQLSEKQYDRWLLYDRLERQLMRQLVRQLVLPLARQLKISPAGRLTLWYRGFGTPAYADIKLREPLEKGIQPEAWAGVGSWFDFCISVLNCVEKQSKWQRKWEIFQTLCKNCGWIFPYDNICLISDRPIKLSFDDRDRLHAEGEPAIQFADGFVLHAYQDVKLPKKYGALPPHEWQAVWLLEERNAELRRVLIQGIGYSRICQELQATELDFWKEYTLLSIDAHPEGDIYSNLGVIEKEPIYLLKMTCPSTGFIHFLRVPPNIQSAREGISWVNWGIDPEEFSLQT